MLNPAAPAEYLADLLLSAYDRLAGHPARHIPPDTIATPAAHPEEPPMSVTPVSPVVQSPGSPIPSPSPASLIHECGLCKVQFDGYPIDDVPGYLKAVLSGLCTVGPSSPGRLQYARTHTCADGRTGLGYLVGVRPAVA